LYIAPKTSPKENVLLEGIHIAVYIYAYIYYLLIYILKLKSRT
jgi:hypothetical protein